MSRSGFVRTPRFESPSVEYDYGPSFPPAGGAQVKLAILAAVGMDPIKGIVHVLQAWVGVTRSLVKSGVWSFPEWHREIDRLLEFLASSQRLVEGIWSTPRAGVKTALEGMLEYRALLRWFARKDKRPQATPAKPKGALPPMPQPPPPEPPGSPGRYNLDLLRDPKTGERLQQVSGAVAAAYCGVGVRHMRKMMQQGQIGYRGSKNNRHPLVADLIKLYPPVRPE